MTVGHGCPHVTVRARSPDLPSANPICLRCHQCALVLLAFVLVVAASAICSPTLFAQTTTAASNVTCELRIVWGGDSQRAYAGTIAVDSGTIRAVRNLCLQSDSIGSIDNGDMQTLEHQSTSLTLFGGVDVRIQGSLTTQLRLSFTNPGAQAPTEFEVPLGELLQGNWIQTLDGRGNRVAIERQVHDRVRVRMSNPSGILEVNQACHFELSGYRSGLNAGQVTADMRFVRGGQPIGKSLQRTLTIDADGSFESAQIEMQVPDQEGAYHLEISLTRQGYLNSLVATSQPLLRRVDVIAFDPQATPMSIVAWKPLVAIDPWRASKPGSLAWLSSLDVLTPMGLQPKLGVPEKLQAYNPLTGSLNQPLTHGELDSRQVLIPNPASGQSESATCLTLKPDSWLAIPLTGLTGDTPHRLRISVPTDLPTELAISLQQTNVVGEFPPLSLDSGVSVGPRQAHRESGQVTEHEVIFWPRGDRAYVVLANLHKELDASVSGIQLERAEMAPTSTGSQAVDSPSAQRMVGINLDKPLLADCVSAKREVDSLTGRPLEAWSTWRESIERICLLLQARGANTLLVKSFSEGGAIFPSEYLAPTRRYDSGTFFSDGRAPEIKDALELMLRHFDRNHLRLIVALDLNTPLPALRRFENATGHESLWQQPLAHGSTPPSRGTPRYNPLNPRVQEAILTVVRDIVDRYGAHPSLAGLAIQLDDQSQLVFAGDRWGYDSQTLADFESSAQLKLPPRDQLETVFSGAPRLAFLEWRAAELTKFHARLGAVVSAGSEQRKLYLNAVRLWDTYPTETNFINAEAIIRNPREYLLAFGISPERLAESPQVELMRGSFDLVSDGVDAQDWIRHESGQRGLVEFFAGADTSALVLRYPRRHQLAAAGKLGEPAPRWIYPSLSPPGEYARKKLINQIFHSDPLLLLEGGWLPFSGHDAGVDPLFDRLRELPPVKLTAVRLQREPSTNLSVRQGTYQGKAYLQIVNNAPWNEAVSIGYQGSLPDSRWKFLGTAQFKLKADEQQKLWSLQVPPFEMVAIEVDDPSWNVTSLRHTPTDDALAKVRREIDQLDTLVSQSADLGQQTLLANIQGDFENWDEHQQPVGWNVGALPQVSIGKSLDLPHTGSSSLLLENLGSENVAAWAQSRPIAPPRTGRLAVQAWLRAPAVSPPLLVKLAVIGRTHSGERFERALTLGSRNAGTTPIPIDWGRRPATLFVGDVSHETIAELSVSIELIGPGKLWVDDVQIFESFLQPDERNHLRGQLLVAKQKLGENNPFPAEQLLDSHWGEYLLRYQPHQDAATKVANLPRTEKTTPLVRPTSSNAWSESPSVFRQFRENFRDRWRR